MTSRRRVNCHHLQWCTESRLNFRRAIAQARFCSILRSGITIMAINNFWTTPGGILLLKRGQVLSEERRPHGGLGFFRVDMQLLRAHQFKFMGSPFGIRRCWRRWYAREEPQQTLRHGSQWDTDVIANLGRNYAELGVAADDRRHVAVVGYKVSLKTKPGS
jgi:hypothetical protein